VGARQRELELAEGYQLRGRAGELFETVTVKDAIDGSDGRCDLDDLHGSLAGGTNRHVDSENTKEQSCGGASNVADGEARSSERTLCLAKRLPIPLAA